MLIISGLRLKGNRREHIVHSLKLSHNWRIWTLGSIYRLLRQSHSTSGRPTQQTQNRKSIILEPSWLGSDNYVWDPYFEWSVRIYFIKINFDLVLLGQYFHFVGSSDAVDDVTIFKKFALGCHRCKFVLFCRKVSFNICRVFWRCRTSVYSCWIIIYS